jgi:hypothetical protein
MKRFILLISIALLTPPAFAQDDGDGGAVDVNSIFGNDGFGRIAERPKMDPFLADIRNSLLTASAPPIEMKQENSLKKAYEKEWKTQAKAFEKRYGATLESAWAQQSSGRGRRGAAGAAASRANATRAAEFQRISDQLKDRMIAALRIDQQAALRRYQSEQLRVTRLNEMLESMTSAGLQLAPQQKQEIETLYARESRLRTLIIIEAKGGPHQKKVIPLELETVDKVEKVLNEAQKVALTEAKARSKDP